MPIDKRRETKVIAVVFADVPGAGAADRDKLRGALERVNQLFLPAIAEPFGLAGEDRLDGALADPAQTPLCLSVLRELIAPLPLRAGRRHRHRRPPARRDGDRPRRLLASPAGPCSWWCATGASPATSAPATPATCSWAPSAASSTRSSARARSSSGRPSPPTASSATSATWPSRLGVTRQSVGDRLAAGNRRAVEEADAAIAAYLSYQRRQRFGG